MAKILLTDVTSKQDKWTLISSASWSSGSYPFGNTNLSNLYTANRPILVVWKYAPGRYTTARYACTLDSWRTKYLRDDANYFEFSCTVPVTLASSSKIIYTSQYLLTPSTGAISSIRRQKLTISGTTSSATASIASFGTYDTLVPYRVYILNSDTF